MPSHTISARSQRLSPFHLLKRLNFKKTTSRQSKTAVATLSPTNRASPIKAYATTYPIIRAPIEAPSSPSFCSAQQATIENTTAWSISTPPLSFVPSLSSLYESDNEEIEPKTRPEFAGDYLVGTHHVDVDEGEESRDSYLGDTRSCEAYTGDDLFDWLEAHMFISMEPTSILDGSEDSSERSRVDSPFCFDVQEVEDSDLAMVISVQDEEALLVQDLEFEDMTSIPPFRFNEVTPPVVLVSKPLRAPIAFHDTIITTSTLFAWTLSSIYDFASYVQQAPSRLYRSTKNAYEAVHELVCSVITYLYLLSWIFTSVKKVFETPPAPVQAPVKSLDEFFVRIVKSLLKRAFGGFVNFWVFLLIGRQLGITLWILLPFCSFIGLVPLIDLVPGGKGSRPILQWDP
ncbi:hypothetical protein FRB97_005010 [Tulasnella sp. 331]|nr:hypothetical protein FRB97_005010 [Tulasnella sp. 331]